MYALLIAATSRPQATMEFVVIHIGVRVGLQRAFKVQFPNGRPTEISNVKNYQRTCLVP